MNSSRMRRQEGATAILVGLSLIMLIGFAGVVVDLGRLFVMKTELQNAADACALAAASQLDGNANALTRAENAGIAAGTRNLVNFQRQAVSITAADIKFSTALSSANGDNSNYLTQAAGAPADSTYALCTLVQPGIPVTLMSILGSGAQTVAAEAVATLAPSQTSCLIPLAVCGTAGVPGFGLQKGDWVGGRAPSGEATGPGDFGWIRFENKPGAKELKELLSGQGICNVQATDGVLPPQPGEVQGVAPHWNSRFGLYGPGNLDAASATPDFTGFAYTATSWPSQRNALEGATQGGSSNFFTQRASNRPYQGDQSAGLKLPPAYQPISASDHALGASRRLATAPIVSCPFAGGTAPVPTLGYACVLLLHPMESPNNPVYLEYLGLANDPASPCASSGLAGGPDSIGPLVPVLVQ